MKLNGFDLVLDPDFPDSLLNLAVWLDSQDALYSVSDARSQKIPLHRFVLTDEYFKAHMSSEFGTYYYRDTTNQERILAVLMLREMCLNGDA